MGLRVIVGYTGGVGSAVVRLVHASPAFELVGVLVHSEDKEGRDVGDIVGIEPTGVIATRDIDALLGLEADVLSWHGIDWQPETKARFLAAGANVYTSMGGWFLPGEPDYELIQGAGAQGGTSLLAGGNIPGLVSDVLPLFASGYSSDIRFIRCTQKDHVPRYPSAFQLSQFLGFGQPVPAEIDLEGELSFADASWVWGIGQSAQIVARGLDIPYSGTKLTKKEYAAAPRDISLEPSGVEIRKGDIAGARWTLTSYSQGRPFYELVNEQTAELGLGADWRQTTDEPNWAVQIEGKPNIEAVFNLPGSHEGADHVAGLNAARAVSCLPRIVACATSGWITMLDVPAAVGLPHSTLAS